MKKRIFTSLFLLLPSTSFSAADPSPPEQVVASPVEACIGKAQMSYSLELNQIRQNELRGVLDHLSAQHRRQLAAMQFEGAKAVCEDTISMNTKTAYEDFDLVQEQE